MTNRLSTEPMSAHGGAIVGGIDASRMPDALTCEELYGLFLEHGLLLFRDQVLSPEQHIAFSRIFGELMAHPDPQFWMDGHPEITLISNAGKAINPGEEDRIVGRIPWHSDTTYSSHPSRGALLYARALPAEGGETVFSDTAAAYDGLSEDMKGRVDRLEMIHGGNQRPPAARAVAAESGAVREDAVSSSNDVYMSKQDSKIAEFPAVIHPLVVTHPRSGRKALNLSPLFARTIVGMPRDEGDELLRDLLAHATSDRYTYVHRWRVGDLMVWDNWRTMHMASGYKARYVRTMHRTTLAGDWEMGRLAA